MAITDDPTRPLWKSDPIELVVDDIVLTPRYAYCVGRYQRIKKQPELWVLSRKTGTVANKVTIAGFPAFLGMSASKGKIFIATREGKVICYTPN